MMNCEIDSFVVNVEYDSACLKERLYYLNFVTPPVRLFVRLCIAVCVCIFVADS
jgi:hypothetical protein